MLTRTRTIIACAAALAFGWGGTAALATTATTWTITPGGSVTGTAGTTKVQDTTTGTTLVCASSATAATLKAGSGQTNPLGKITSVTFSNCSGPAGFRPTMTSSASPTNPYLLDGAAATLNGVTKVRITNVMISISGQGCSATLAGLTSTSPGKITGKFTNSTGILKVTGGNLHIWNVTSGCLGIINNGDPAKPTGSYMITPAQTITSP